MTTVTTFRCHSLPDAAEINVPQDCLGFWVASPGLSVGITLSPEVQLQLAEELRWQALQAMDKLPEPDEYRPKRNGMSALIRDILGDDRPLLDGDGYNELDDVVTTDASATGS